MFIDPGFARACRWPKPSGRAAQSTSSGARSCAWCAGARRASGLSLFATVVLFRDTGLDVYIPLVPAASGGKFKSQSAPPHRARFHRLGDRRGPKKHSRRAAVRTARAAPPPARYSGSPRPAACRRSSTRPRAASAEPRLDLRLLNPGFAESLRGRSWGPWPGPTDPQVLRLRGRCISPRPRGFWPCRMSLC